MLQTFYLGTKFATRRCIEVPGAPTCFGNWVDSVNGVDQWEKFKKKYIHCNPQQCPGNFIVLATKGTTIVWKCGLHYEPSH